MSTPSILDKLFASERDAAEIAASIRDEHRRNAAREWKMPPEPEGYGPVIDFSLQWGTRDELEELGIEPPPAPGDALDIETFRRFFPQRITSLLQQKHDKQTIQLIAVPPGGGKTYAAVQAAQAFADDGKRVLWLGARHDALENIMLSIPGVMPQHWYNWLAMSAELPNGETACREFEAAMAHWLAKGYPAGKLCYQLCTAHAAKCPFRQQGNIARGAEIVFARHQHLQYGLDAGAFDAMIIDENPMSALINTRDIPAGWLATGAASPSVAELTGKLEELATHGKTLKGRALFDEIGDILDEIYTLADLERLSLPDIPRVAHSSDVAAVPYWYIYDFLKLANQEFHAWAQQWPLWESRIWIDSAGLHMVDRAEIWSDAPCNIMVLDATAHDGIYRQMFPGVEIERQAPVIRRVGRIHQIVNRNNGTSDMSSDDKPHAEDALATIRALIAYHGYEKMGVICHKSTREFFEGAGLDCLHFGALRGENRFQNVDALFVVGAWSLPASALRRLAVIFGDDIAPLADAYHSVKPRAFVVPGDKIPYRPVGGFWDNPSMQAMHEQYREMEMLQAIYRARPLTNPCDIWILSAVPVVPLDAIYPDPRAATGGVSGCEWIGWRDWVRLVPYLAEAYQGDYVFGYEELSELFDGDKKALKRARSGKWLEKIVAAWGGRIATVAIPGKRGRPPQKVRPLDT